MPSIEIDLTLLTVGAGLIIPAETGIHWRTQAGGVSCLQNVLEGLFIPFNSDQTSSTSEDGLYCRLEAFYEREGRVWSANADHFDALLAADASTAWVRLDRERLSESDEAWVHVVMAPVGDWPVKGLPPGPAVLTWLNSD